MTDAVPRAVDPRSSGAPLARIASWGCPTASAAVVAPQGRLATYGDPTRRSRIASVTKPIFALAVLIAVEEGIVELDEPLGPPGSTVRHLLAHASGLPFLAGPAPLAPGTRRIYSNLGFDVLGEHLAARSAMSCADYLRLGVFEPLGMTDSALQGSVARDVWSTVDDLTRFARELLRPTLVHRSTLDEATRVQFPALGGVLPGYEPVEQDPCPWGLGIEIRGGKDPHWTGRGNSPATFGHFGATGSLLWVDPVADLALVVLADREFGPWAHPLWPDLADAVLAVASLQG